MVTGGHDGDTPPSRGHSVGPSITDAVTLGKILDFDDLADQCHDRSEVDLLRGPGRWVDPVKANADAHHVEACRRKANGPGRVCRVLDEVLESKLFRGTCHFR